MKVRVYGGYYHGRVLILPESARKNDFVELPTDLPKGETWGLGRTNPELHIEQRTYKVIEPTVGDGGKYLTSAPDIRYVRSVEVPPANAETVTVWLR